MYSKIPDCLAKRFCVVESWDGIVEFSGRYDECLTYLRKNIRRVKQELIDLRYAVKCDHGLIEVGIFASYVL